MMNDHVHAIATEDGDECECGQILCPDTGTPVGYDPDGPGPSYWHLDGTTCFLHQVVVEEG